MADRLTVSANSLLYLYGILQLERGPEAYAAFLRLLRSPGVVFFNVVALLLAPMANELTGRVCDNTTSSVPP